MAVPMPSVARPKKRGLAHNTAGNHHSFSLHRPFDVYCTFLCSSVISGWELPTFLDHVGNPPSWISAVTLWMADSRPNDTQSVIVTDYQFRPYVDP